MHYTLQYGCKLYAVFYNYDYAILSISIYQYQLLLIYMLKFMVVFILFNVYNDSTDTLRVYQICSHPQNMNISFISNFPMSQSQYHSICSRIRFFTTKQYCVYWKIRNFSIRLMVYMYTCIHYLVSNQRTGATYQGQQLTIGTACTINKCH